MGLTSERRESVLRKIAALADPLLSAAGAPVRAVAGGVGDLLLGAKQTSGALAGMRKKFVLRSVDAAEADAIRRGAQPGSLLSSTPTAGGSYQALVARPASLPLRLASEHPFLTAAVGYGMLSDSGPAQLARSLALMPVETAAAPFSGAARALVDPMGTLDPSVLAKFRTPVGAVDPAYSALAARRLPQKWRLRDVVQPVEPGPPQDVA